MSTFRLSFAGMRRSVLWIALWASAGGCGSATTDAPGAAAPVADELAVGRGHAGGPRAVPRRSGPATTAPTVVDPELAARQQRYLDAWARLGQQPGLSADEREARREALKQELVVASPVLAPALTAGAGGRVKDVPATYIHTQTLVIPPWVSATIETLALSPATADTVLHVQDAKSGDFITGNDDYNGSLRSRVFLIAAAGWRSVTIVVRASGSASAGSATLRVTLNPGTVTDTAISFAGTPVAASPASLAATAHVYTVEQAGGTSDTVLLVVSGASSHAIAFDDEDGVASMSWIHLPTDCSSCKLIVGHVKGAGDGATTVVWDEDIHTADCDGDGLGDGLELAVGTARCDADSDNDGLRDGAELGGVSDGNNGNDVKLPLYGADPLHKDLFIELDWRMDRAPLSPSKALKVAAFYAPDVAVHLDTGVANDNPATATIYNDWGGASSVPLGSPYCGGLTPTRVGLFHHGQLIDSGGQADSLNGYCFVSSSEPGVIAQESAHGMTLDHGGQPSTGPLNCKPHYRSPMNYAFAYDSSLSQFSRNTFGGVVLNGTAVDESLGLGTSDWSQISYLTGGTFQYKVRADGAIDWNRDGEFAPPGTLVRAAVTWGNGSCEQSGVRREDVSSTSHDPTLFRLTDPAPRLFLMTRRVSDGKLEYRQAIDLSPCSLPGTEPCASWMPALSTLPTLVQESVTGTLAPSAVEFRDGGGTGRGLVVYGDSANRLRFHIMTMGGTGVPWFTNAAVTGAGSTVVSSAPTALALTDRVRVFAVVDGLLRHWDYLTDSGVWSATTFTDRWSDGTEVAAGGAIAVTRGYLQGGNVEQTFAAIPDADQQVVLARFDTGTQRWVRLAVPNAPVTTSRPGLAYVPYDKTVSLKSGRFFLLVHDGDQQVLRIAMTEGNDAQPGALTKRLTWLQSVEFTNAWLFGRGATSLLFDHAYDDNLRAAMVFSNPNGVDKVVFAPLADGVVNLDLKDQNDYGYITSHLACSLTHSCN